jgi:hypothetical protein
LGIIPLIDARYKIIAGPKDKYVLILSNIKRELQIEDLIPVGGFIALQVLLKLKRLRYGACRSDWHVRTRLRRR